MQRCACSNPSAGSCWQQVDVWFPGKPPHTPGGFQWPTSTSSNNHLPCKSLFFSGWKTVWKGRLLSHSSNRQIRAGEGSHPGSPGNCGASVAHWAACQRVWAHAHRVHSCLQLFSLRCSQYTSRPGGMGGKTTTASPSPLSLFVSPTVARPRSPFHRWWSATARALASLLTPSPPPPQRQTPVTEQDAHFVSACLCKNCFNMYFWERCCLLNKSLCQRSTKGAIGRNLGVSHWLYLFPLFCSPRFFSSLLSDWLSAPTAQHQQLHSPAQSALISPRDCNTSINCLSNFLHHVDSFLKHSEGLLQTKVQPRWWWWWWISLV